MKINEILKRKNKTIASIESFTGGAFSYEFIKHPGASNFFKGSLIAYSNEIKEKFGIRTSNGVVNKNTAKEMAILGKKYFNVDYCISFTGNAGPNALDNKEVGLIYIGINENVFEIRFKNLSRNEIILESISFAIEKLKEIVELDETN